MDKATYIEENKSYLGDSLAVLEFLTEDQFQTLAQVTEEMGNADVGIDNQPVKSSEMIVDFENSRKNINEVIFPKHVQVVRLETIFRANREIVSQQNDY